MGNRARFWIRVSTGGQDETSQVPDLIAYAAAHGYEVDAKRYVLHDKSASKGEQEEMQQEVCEDLRRGEFDVLVIWHSDRWERRGTRVLLRTLDEIQDAGGRIESTKEPWLGSDGVMGETMTAMAASVARQESVHKAERSAMGIAAAVANGAATGSAPWAYHVGGEKRHKRFVFESEHQPVIVAIFKDISNGKSATQAAAEYSTAEKKWFPNTVSKMIRNPVYKGVFVNKDGIITHRCEAAVDARLWADANKALSARERKTRGRSPKAMLSSVARCGVCDGSAMYRTPDEAKRNVRFYRCSASHGVTVQVPLAEAAVSDCLLAVHGGTELTRREKIPGHNWDAQIEETKFELRHLDPDSDDYDERHAALRAHLADLKARPAVADRWDEVPLGITFGEVWRDKATDLERGDYLRSKGIKAYFRPVSRTVVDVSFEWGSLASMEAEFPAYAGIHGTDEDGFDRVWWRFDSVTGKII